MCNRSWTLLVPGCSSYLPTLTRLRNCLKSCLPELETTSPWVWKTVVPQQVAELLTLTTSSTPAIIQYSRFVVISHLFLESLILRKHHIHHIHRESTELKVESTFLLCFAGIWPWKGCFLSTVEFNPDCEILLQRQQRYVSVRARKEKWSPSNNNKIEICQTSL